MGAYRDLRALSDEELIRKYDEMMGTTHAGLEYYRDELLRRETARGTAEIIKLTAELLNYTRQIWWLTVTVAAAALLALAISVVGLITKVG